MKLTRIVSLIFAGVLVLSTQTLADDGNIIRGIKHQYPALNQPVTSFGAVRHKERIYIYGGHTGEAHDYWEGSQANKLLALDIENGKEWLELAEGPALQGLALIAYEDKIIRIGGFHAKNPKGEKQELYSTDEVLSFNIQSRKWEPLPALPEPRSSLDAFILGESVYVVGGWQLRGKESAVWHRDAYRLNLAVEDSKWERIASPPFERRANAVISFDGKIYAIGGMQQKGGPTTKVSIYDPAANSWTEGPSLPGEPMEGFGAAAVVLDERLFVATHHGKLVRLSDDQATWQIQGTLPTARFFQRIVPVDDERALIIGGADMDSGKFTELELIDFVE